MNKKNRWLYAAALTPFMAFQAHAQVASDSEPSLADRFLEEVVITGTKKKNPENVQDVPLAVTAFGAQQLEDLNVSNFTDIGRNVPNAILSEIGTFKGIAGFTIRGQAANSSIPTIDPAVGTFVDGVYYGINSGVIMDTFDLESIEVLRGPQGILFGRNVVGGAVLINTKLPTDELTGELKFGADSGLRGTGSNYTMSGVISGPITKKVKAKIAAYRNDDNGWFLNKFDNKAYGKSETNVLRGALSVDPADNVSFVLRVEHGDQKGEGTPMQSHLNPTNGVPGENFSRSSHDVSQDNRGSQRSKWNQAILETNIGVALGDGMITNILGWREYKNQFCFDLDATPKTRFDVNCVQTTVGAPVESLSDWGTEQKQYSDELRYSGTFGKNLDLTTGLYYLNQDIAYAENRNLYGDGSRGNTDPIRQSGGGIQGQEVFGAFANVDYRIGNDLTVSGGLRYTNEKKNAKIASLSANKGPQPLAGFCVVTAGTCPYDFNENTPGYKSKTSWSNVDFTLGFNYEWTEHARVYGRWATSQKSGGYNVRNSRASDSPGPSDPEKTNSFELGLKTEPTSRSVLNVGAFYTMTKSMQKSVLVSTIFGPSQSIRNTADVDIVGLEFDGQIALTNSLTFMGSFGILDSKYKKVLYDISGDGLVNDLDKQLKLPRVADMNFAATLVHEFSLKDHGTITSRISYTYRGEQFTNDANTGTMPSQELVDFNMRYQPTNSNWSLSLYGKNIFNDVVYYLDVELPSTIGSTYSGLAKGRQFGAEVKLGF